MARRQAPKRRMMTASEMGKKGGASRMARLTPEERRALSRKAARARWDKRAD